MMLLTFGLGCLWMMLVGIQTKLLVQAKSDWMLFGWVLMTSVIWGYLVRSVVIDPSAIIPYAIGTGFGALLARKLGKYIENK